MAGRRGQPVTRLGELSQLGHFVAAELVAADDGRAAELLVAGDQRLVVVRESGVPLVCRQHGGTESAEGTFVVPGRAARADNGLGRAKDPSLVLWDGAGGPHPFAPVATATPTETWLKRSLVITMARSAVRNDRSLGLATCCG